LTLFPGLRDTDPMTVTANLLTAREAVETAGMMMPASADVCCRMCA
jgi:hypothetical protein